MGEPSYEQQLFQTGQQRPKSENRHVANFLTAFILIKLCLLEAIAGQSTVLLRGDIIQANLPGESASMRYGTYYSDESNPKVPGFVVRDSIGPAVKGAGTHHCEFNLILPHASQILVKICESGTKLIMEEAKGSLTAFVNTFDVKSRLGDYVYKDVVPLIDDTQSTSFLAAIQQSPGTGDFNISLLNYNMNMSSQSASQTFGSSAEGLRIANPKLAAFCPKNGKNCTLIVYDHRSSKDAPMQVYLVTLSANPTIQLLTSFKAASSFINKQHEVVGIFQSGPSLFYAAVMDNNLNTYAIGFNESAGHKMFEVAGGSKSFPGLGATGTQYFVHFTATKAHQMSVVLASGSITYLIRVHLVQLYEFKAQLPACFKNWAGAAVTSHSIDGLHGVVVFTNTTNDFPIGMLVYARPYEAGSEAADGRCMSTQNVKQGHIDLLRGELVEFGTSNNQVYKLQTPEISFDTQGVGDSLLQLKIKATNLATGQSSISQKNFTVVSDLFSMGLQKQQMFTKVWEETSTMEFYESEFPTHVEMSINEVVSNGGKYKIQGDNVISYSTGLSSPEYKFSGITHTALQNFSKAVFLRRDLLVLQYGSAKLALFGCLEFTNRGRDCKLVRDLDPHGDRQTPPPIQKQIILPIANPDYLAELALDYPTSEAFMVTVMGISGVSRFLQQEQINQKIKSYVWRTNGKGGVLYYITEAKPESVFRLTVDPSQIKNAELELINGKAKICARDIAVSPNNMEEVMVYSACPGEDAYMTAFDLQSSPAVNMYQKYFKVKESHQSLTVCSLQSNHLYLTPSRSELRLINAKGHDLSLNFPAGSEAMGLFACLPQIGYFVLLRRIPTSNKFFLVLYGQATPEAEVVGERVQAVLEVSGLSSAEGLELTATFERRDLSVYVLLTPRDSSVGETQNHTLRAYRLAIDVGDVVVKPAAGTKLTSLSLQFTHPLSDKTNTTALKFKASVPLLKPTVRKYQPLPKNQQGTFNFDTYSEFQGNYYGLELRGMTKDQAEVRDRLREDSARLSSEFAVLPLVATAGPFVVMARPNTKMVLYKNYLNDSSRSKLTLDELDSVDEIGMVEDSASNFLLIMARKETLAGNDFVLYWIRTDGPLPSSSSATGVYRWSNVGSFIRLNFFSTVALEGSHHHFIGSLMNEARRAVLVFTFIFDKSYSTLLMVNTQTIENKHILEDVFLNRDKSWVLIKQRGSTMTIAKADRKQGDSLLLAYNEVYKPFQDAAVIAAYCTKIGTSFCVYESSSRFYFTEGEDAKGNFEKIPGFRTVAWSINNNFIAILLKSLHVGLDEQISRRIAIFKRGYVGVYSLYKLDGQIDDRQLGENLNNAFALLETPEGAVILISDRLKSQKLQLMQQSTTSYPLISNKIELVIKDPNLSAENFKLVFKSENPQNEFVRGLFVDPGIYPPSDPKSESKFWLILLIVVGATILVAVIAFLVYKYLTKWRYENASTDLDADQSKYTDVDHL